MTPSFTIGIEEEYQTIDPETFDLRSHINTEIMAEGRRQLDERVKAEMHQAVVEAFPGLEGLSCQTFEGAIAAVREGRADLAMLPVENSTYGRIADIHHLLPESGLHIIGEHFVRVHANLLGVPGARLEQVRLENSQALVSVAEKVAVRPG